MEASGNFWKLQVNAWFWCVLVSTTTMHIAKLDFEAHAETPQGQNLGLSRVLNVAPHEVPRRSAGSRPGPKLEGGNPNVRSHGRSVPESPNALAISCLGKLSQRGVSLFPEMGNADCHCHPRTPLSCPTSPVTHMRPQLRKTRDV